MEINPGGRLGLNEIVGRDDDIRRYWDVLKRQGLILSGERRIGKSHIVWKMDGEGQDGFITLYQDLEGINTTIELIRSIYAAVGSRLTALTKAKAKLVDLWGAFAPKRM